MSKIIDMKFFFLKILVLAVVYIASPYLQAETIELKDAPGILPAILDIPPEWEKTQVVKNNGLIFTLKKGNAQIELRSFLAPNTSMDYIINARAARLYSQNVYVSLLLDKSEETGDTRKRTLIWQMNRQSETWYERTLIIYYENNVMILSCTAPESEYRSNRVLFENAFLSLKFNVTERPVPEKPAPVEPTDNESNQLIRDLEDTREHNADKLEKLQNDNENP